MADRRWRGPVLGVALVLLAAALASLIAVLATGPSNHRPPRSIVTQPVRIDGLLPTKISVDLNIMGTRTQVEPALQADLVRASGIAGLYGCAPNPPDMSSMPASPGFFCVATSSFNTASLVTLEVLSHVSGIGGSNARRHYESLFYLGVQRGEPALVVQPIGNSQRVRSDLAVLRGLPGVLHCGSADVGPFLADMIACATSSHAEALHAQMAAEHLNVAYAEVMTSW